MGIVRKARQKRVFHKKRWDKATIEEEREVVQDYAMKNKKEIRKFEFLLKNIKIQAKELNRQNSAGLSDEAKEFVNRLFVKGFLKNTDAGLDDVLSITLRDVLDRRLASIVYKRKLARTTQQARQFISHGHIKVNGKKIDSANALISRDVEENIEFNNKSVLADENHPTRKEEFEETLSEEEEILASKNRSPQEEAEEFDIAEAKAEDEETKEVKKDE